MSIRRGFVGVTLMNGISRVLNHLSLVAYAEGEETSEEGTTVEEGEKDEPQGSSISFEDLVSKARNEEKRKQYKRIEGLDKQVKDLREKNNSLMLKVGDLEQKLDEANNKLVESKSGDSEEVKTLKSEISRITEELEKANAELQKFKDTPPVNREEVEKEVRAELEKEYEIKAYRAEKIAPYADDPTVMVELVTGDTKEDIDATLEAALKRSADIKKSLGLKNDNTPDNRRTPKNPSNPAVQATGGIGSEDMLQELLQYDPSSKEYAELRSKLGLV